jgi:uncharacterized protein (DUF1501 family)
MGSMSPFLQSVLAGEVNAGKKLLFIFMRGGMDSVGTVMPYGDAGIPGKAPTYLEARPTLGVPPDEAFDLNGFCGLNPNMQGEADDAPKLYDIFNGTLDPSRPRQDLAILHRVGYERQNRSHFTSQQLWENGTDDQAALENGVFNRYIGAYLDESKPMQAAAINGNQMVIMKGDVLIPVLRTINDYSLPTNVQLGSLPSKGNPLGSGLKGAYGQTGFNASVKYNPLTYGTGKTLLESLQFFQDSVLGVPYSPKAEAQPFYSNIANNGFRQSIQDCARLLRQVDDIQIVGCNQGGYDTHGSQQNRLPPLQRDLALAFTGLYFDLEDIWDDVVVVTMSEFGRTTLQNGNNGTDHGQASVCFAMGGPINGGVYDGDAASWPNGTLVGAGGRYLLEGHDFRAMYGEILTKHLGDPDSQLDTIIPGYSTLAADDPRGLFTERNFVQG